MNRIALLAFGLGAASALAAAQERPNTVGNSPVSPDRPGIANGPTVVGPRNFLVETALQHESYRDGTRALLLPTLLRAGVSERFEVRLETNALLGIAYSSGRSTTGYSPLSVGGKWQLASADGPTGIDVGVIGRLFPVSGSGRFESDSVQGDLLIAANLNAGKFSFTPNLGFTTYSSEGDRTRTAMTAALTIGYSLPHRESLFIDAGYQSSGSGDDGGSSLILDFGGTMLLSDDIQIDLSVGQGVMGSAAPRPFIAAGFSYRFR